MNYKIILLCIISSTVLATSCKKDKTPAIVGKWVSISNYTEENGNFSWKPTDGYSQYITFNPDARFSTFIDIPTGSGTYAYDSPASKINLRYEADHYGNVATTVTYTIDELTDTHLVISSFSPSGELQFRTEYSRLD